MNFQSAFPKFKMKFIITAVSFKEAFEAGGYFCELHPVYD